MDNNIQSGSPVPSSNRPHFDHQKSVAQRKLAGHKVSWVDNKKASTPLALPEHTQSNPKSGKKFTAKVVSPEKGAAVTSLANQMIPRNLG